MSNPFLRGRVMGRGVVEQWKETTRLECTLVLRFALN